ncbi:2-polyprenyl-6-methoxyphenol hydroxylase [Seinonella peptonophila]|uniref:2-polyprenyl-6-methoxyphenol hydroxylase n=1 Tax=Seinonella peptonophila TaxID=112248 RepID=A0A1M4TZ95_9BACL|nr:FAD-dependent monooxygenase [Seinonella peptonophila]SHE49657.1 2-polyprenyl-6-methoxyphenol hydroxylase [Seinonella peptonophila]
MSRDKFDVAIIGSGIGGAFLAFLLGRAGLNVVVLERGLTIGNRGAEFLKFGGIRIFEHYGLLSSLLHRGALKRKVIKYYHDGQLIDHFDFSKYGSDYIIAPYKEIVGTVTTACSNYPKVEYWFNSTVSYIETESDIASRLYLQDGRIIKADVFIGADGVQSIVHPYMNAQIETRQYNHSIYGGFMQAVPSVWEFNRLYFSSDGWFAYFYPLDKRITRIFIGIPSTIHLNNIIHPSKLINHLSTFVSESIDVLTGLTSVRFHKIPVSSSLASIYHHFNVIALGNAAFSFHPMTGLGMSYTLEDAKILAEVILDGFHDVQVLNQLLKSRYAPRRKVHEQILEYGDQLARTYSDVVKYKQIFQPHLHIGQVST